MKRLLVATLAAMVCCSAGLGCRHAFPHYPDPGFAQRRHEGPFLGGFPQNGSRWGRCFQGHGGHCNCPDDAGRMGRMGMGGYNRGAPLEPAPGMSAGAVGYPYYTVRGPRDFLVDNPPSIGP